MRPNISKLITGFLILSLGVGASAFILTNRPIGPLAQEEPAQEKQATLLAKNAFVEVLTASSTAGGGGAIDPSNPNLTDIFAKRLADNVLEKNPEGPLDIEGSLAIEIPSVESFAANFALDPRVVSRIITEEITGGVTQKSLSVIENPTNQDLVSYFSSFQKTLNNGPLSPRFADVLGGNGSTEALNVAELVFSQSTAEFKKVPVPKPLVELHLRAVNLLSSVHRMTTLKGESGDPLQELYAFEQYSREAEGLVAAFTDELQKLKNPQLLGHFDGEKNNLSFLSLIGTREALAIAVPVADILNAAQHTLTSGSTLASKILEFLKNYRTIILNIIKDRLIHRLVQQTIIWIQGGGKPQFVENWKGFLSDAANEAAGDVINRITPGLCQGFGPLIQVAFLRAQPATTQVACTLDQVVANIRSFANDFKNGGWQAYGASLEPQNNLFGVIALTGDLVAKKASEAEKAAQNEATASGGYKSQKLPSNWKTVNEYRDCMAREGLDSCDDACPCAGLADVDVRVPVDYKTTTPGKTVGDIVHETLPSPIARIVNAEDITALTSALINSALNKLLKIGSKGLARLPATPPETRSGGSICAGFTGGQRRDCERAERNACNGLTGDDYLECVNALGRGTPFTGDVCDGSCDAPSEPMRYEADVEAAIAAEEGNFDLSVPENAAGFRAAVLAQLTNRGFIGTDAPRNCNGRIKDRPDDDAIIIGNAGDQYAEYYDIIVNSGAPNARAGIGASEKAAWSRCTGCAQTTPNACTPVEGGKFYKGCSGNSCVLIAGTGSDQCTRDVQCQTQVHKECRQNQCVLVSGPGADQCTADSQCGQRQRVITDINPSRAAPGTQVTLLGSNLTGTVQITNDQGARTTVSGSINNEKTEAAFVVPSLANGEYFVAVGPNTTDVSNEVSLIVNRDQGGGGGGGGGGPGPGTQEIIVNATPGWNGGLAYNTTNNTWLVVSQGNAGGAVSALGRILQANGAAVSPVFEIDEVNDRFAGGAKAAYAPGANKFLVVWSQEDGPNAPTVKVWGRFVGPNGNFMGPSFAVTPNYSGGIILSSNQNLQYDSGRQKFVITWQGGAQGVSDAYLATVGLDGTLGPTVRVAESPNFEGQPAVAINTTNPEYCVAYQWNDNGPVSKIAVRTVDPTTGQIGPESFVSQSAFGRAQIAWDSVQRRYLVTWASLNELGKLEGRFIQSCSGGSGGNVLALAQGIMDVKLAYNRISNTFALIGGYPTDVRNRFVLLNPNGTTRDAVDIFVDARNGNYAPDIIANPTTGGYGVASSQDYATYRFSPNPTISILGY